MMNKLLTEWNKFLTEKEASKTPPVDPNRANIERIRKQNIALINAAIAPYKGKPVYGADFGLFLEKLATFESRYDPKAINGSYKGAFQLSDDIAAGADPYNPAKAAKALYTFFTTQIDGLIKENPDLPQLIKNSPMLFLFLVHNQGKYGAVRVLYTVNGLAAKLKNKIDTKIGPEGKEKSTIDNINAQKIKDLTAKEAAVSKEVTNKNVRIATAFVDYLKEKYQL